MWIDADRLVISVERDDTTRLAVVDSGDAWPRRLATAHGDLDEHGDEGEAVVSPDGREVAYTFTPRADLNRSEIRVASIEGGDVRALTGTPRMHDAGPAWSPDGTRSPTYRSAAASTSCISWGATAPATGSSRARAPTTGTSTGTPTARACSRCAAAATASTS